MLEKASYITMLLKKHLKDELSEEEKLALSEWINDSPENMQTFERLTSADSLQHLISEYYNAINYAKEFKLSRKPKVVQINARNRKWFFYISAASIIILFVTVGTYFLMTRQDTKPKVIHTNTTNPSFEIPPARDKAILTLSDGSTVSLTDANNGTVAQEGETIITKNQNGEIIYKKSKPTKGDRLLYNSITTPRGGKFKIILPDGSKVWLNAATVLQYPSTFDDKKRKIALSGEAYFEIKEDKNRPFIVTIVTISEFRQTVSEIEVLGTHFNVNAYVDEPEVSATLLEGKIKFTAGIQNKGPVSKLLFPGQRALLGKETNDLKVGDTDDPGASIAWINGKFAFENKDLTSIMRELARWYDIQVQYKGTEQTKVLYTGEVDRMIPLADLLSTLEQMGTTKFTLNGRTVMINP